MSAEILLSLMVGATCFGAALIIGQPSAWIANRVAAATLSRTRVELVDR